MELLALAFTTDYLMTFIITGMAANVFSHFVMGIIVGVRLSKLDGDDASKAVAFIKSMNSFIRTNNSKSKRVLNVLLTLLPFYECYIHMIMLHNLNKFKGFVGLAMAFIQAESYSLVNLLKKKSKAPQE